MPGDNGSERKAPGPDDCLNQLSKACLAEGLRICRFFDESASRIGLLVLGNGTNGRKIEEERLTDIIKRTASSFSDMCICVSGQSLGLSGVQDLYRQACSVRDQLLASMRAGLYFYRDFKGTSTEGYAWEDMMGHSESLLRCVEENDAVGIHTAADCLSLLFTSSSVPPGWMQVCISHIRSQLLRKLIDAGGDAVMLNEWIPLQRSGCSPESRQWFGEKLRPLCLKAAAVIVEHQSGRQADTMSKALTFIESHFHEKVQLQDLAKRFCTSPVYLGQQFKRETGHSFNEYVHKLRIDEAKKLLRRTDMKVTAIAQSLGYHDTDYFTEKFKALTSHSPSSYKNQYKGELHATWREPVS